MGAELVGLHYRAASPAAVAGAHESGLQLTVWTPNELPEMQAMIALGVDGITTDRPDVLLDHLKGQGGP
jgi:glycerophosphoryl diester phosphodiesterase